jgi:NAD(P)-dependent dehydrogenase (short-subunit alcohol dehydrogenase family)
MSLQGRVAIVTGAAQGIGRAIAETLAEAGADIVVADLDPARSKDAVTAVEKLGRKALNIKVNVADANETKAMADQVIKEWGKIDILVNNAGITRDGLLLRMKEEDWNLVLQVNLNGTFNCTKAVLQPMTKQRYGRIVNIASIVGAMGIQQDGSPRICKPQRHRQRRCAGIHRYGDDAGVVGRSERGAAEANSPGAVRDAGGYRKRRALPSV